jgi:hypothetical protein
LQARVAPQANEKDSYMHFFHPLAFALSLAAFTGTALAQGAPHNSHITMGNGTANAIQIEGLARRSAASIVSEFRVDSANAPIMRANSTSITFPKVTIEKAGWLVLHPVIDGRPDGDIVSGFAYLKQGQNKDVEIEMKHPAGAGDKFLVMLHSDVDRDRVFDFVFVADGVNVEDTAVFEGTRMIAHLISLPK